MNKAHKRTIQTADFGEATITAGSYVNGGLAVQLYCQLEDAPEGVMEPLATLSMWLEDSPRLPENCFFAKLYSENELIAEDAARSGWFEEVWEVVHPDPVWRLRAVKGEGFSLMEN